MSEVSPVSTGSDEEDIPQMKIPLKVQWKRISKRVGFQKNWTKECIVKVLKDSNGDAFQGKDLERIPFNANLYKACVQAGRLSERAKHLFMKNPDIRSSKDIAELFRAVEKLQCFSKYSRAVKQGLAKFVYYSEFPQGRVIVQQGHPAFSFYFILQGSVNVMVEERSKSTGELTKNIVGEILAGNSFGELALIHDTERRASIICKEQSEFLRLDKSDFNQVLRETYEKEWNLRMTYLQGIPAFKNWTKLELKAANNATQMVDVPENTVVFKEDSDPSETVCVIKSGKCVVVREMDIVRKALPFGREKLVLPREDTRSLRRLRQNEAMLKFYLNIKTLNAGDYFGVGEPMKDIYIITKTKTELMLIPAVILEIHNRGKALSDMRSALVQNNWTKEDIFQAFMETRNWNNYKRREADMVALRKPKLRTTKISDIPVFIRKDNPYCL